MPSPKRAPGAGLGFAIDPGQIPDDGTTVTFEQTFAKKLGPATGTQNPLADEDYEVMDWSLDRQFPNGSRSFLRVCKGRPYPHTMGDADPGVYIATPIDRTRNNRLVREKEVKFTIGTPAETASAPAAPVVDLPRGMPDAGLNAMPPWMQVLFQREAEERAEQRRRQEDDARRREAWERDQALKEEARREREERMAELRAEREAIARKEAADRTNALILAGMQLAQQVMAKPAPTPPPPPERRDDRIQELLLSHILSERSQAAQQGPQSSIKESLELVVALDQLAQSRADRLPPPAADEKEEPESMGSTMMKMLPMLVGGSLAGGGGGASAPSASPAPAMPSMDNLLAGALNNPEIIARVAAQNPEAIARTFSKVVKADKRLEEAVIKVLSEDDETEGG